LNSLGKSSSHRRFSRKAKGSFVIPEIPIPS
jgi:hypothetical protein